MLHDRLYSSPHREEAAGQTVGYSEELGSARSTLDSLREQLAMWQQKCGDAEMGIRDLRKQLAATATQVSCERSVHVSVSVSVVCKKDLPS